MARPWEVYGLTMPVIPGVIPCLRCVYPNAPEGAQPTCETAGVLNAIISAVASLQVAMPCTLSGHPEKVRARIATMDVWEGTLRQIDAPERDPDCPCCARREFAFWRARSAASEPVRCATRCRYGARAATRSAGLRARLEPLGEVRANEFALRFAVNGYEMTFFPDGRAIVKGTDDLGSCAPVFMRGISDKDEHKTCAICRPLPGIETFSSASRSEMLRMATRNGFEDAGILAPSQEGSGTG